MSAWDVICVASRQTEHQRELSASSVFIMCQFPQTCAAAPPEHHLPAQIKTDLTPLPSPF